jgi:RNA polymerase sigma factor (sigma-70 family)
VQRLQHAAIGGDAGGAIGEASTVNRGQQASHCFARLYRELFPPLFGYIRFRVGDQHLAEDLTAHVLERALSRLATVQRPEHVRAWLFAIARNAIADARRARRPAAELVAAEALESLWVESPETAALRHEEQRPLMAHVANLGERER